MVGFYFFVILLAIVRFLMHEYIENIVLRNTIIQMPVSLKWKASSRDGIWAANKIENSLDAMVCSMF